VLKPRHSAFFGTPLEFLLDELAVNQLILTGLSTDSCIMFTAHDGYLRKYDLWIPRDCVAAEKDDYQDAALEHMERTMKAATDPVGGRATRQPRKAAKSARGASGSTTKHRAKTR
jgi:nicotinamidase-related amidase